MRRWTRVILISLVLGAVVNVLVAWWAAYRLPIATRGHGQASGADTVLVCSGIGVTVRAGCGHPIWPGADLSREWQRGTMGWPLQSMSWSVRYRHGELLHESTYQEGLHVGEKLVYGNPRIAPAIEWRLPLRAEPLPFVANSALYGGLLAPVIWLSPFGRTWRAFRRSPRRAVFRMVALAACMVPVVVVVSWTTVFVGKRSITSWTVGSTEWPGPFPSWAGEPTGVNVYTSWTRVDRDWRTFEGRDPGLAILNPTPFTQRDFGFPLFAMSRLEWKPDIFTWRNDRFGKEHDYGSRQSILLRGIALPEALDLDPTTRLPLRPCPLAFLGNTLIYAIILLTLHAMWCEGRERWRTRRGRCLSCGYDMTGVERCPECGNEHQS